MEQHNSDNVVPPAMFYGSSDEETYSQISKYTSGSYYDEIKETVEDCLDKILDKRIQEGCGMISIADFGTADGVNFLHLLKDIMGTVDKKSKSLLQMTVYLNDQPCNDFNHLLSKVNEYESKENNVFFVVSGRSMYKQCLPNGCLDLAVSSTAIHWLSEIPCTLKNGLTWLSGSEQEKQMFQEQAKADWKQFLLARGNELKIDNIYNHGGQNGFSNPTPDEKSGVMVILVITKETDEHGSNCLKGISEAWIEMYKRGKINHDEFQRTTLGLYTGRTEFELRSAFEDPEICKSGLKLVSIRDSKHYLRPLISLYQQSEKSAFAHTLVEFIHPWVRNVIYQGLSETRLPDDKERILEEYFKIVFKMALEDQFQIKNLHNKEVIATKLEFMYHKM